MKTPKTLLWEKSELKILDQRMLPGRVEYIACRDLETVIRAIKTLAVRGAPAIGAAAAYGMALAAANSRTGARTEFLKGLRKDAGRLKASRPTAVNLAWAVERVMERASENSGTPVPELKKIILDEASRIHEEDEETCRRLSENGAPLIPHGSSVITYCNAGALATAGMGTALGVLYAARELGRKFRVFACETRPLLQGARLTAWELGKEKVDVTLICDSAAGSVMGRGMADIVITGADRIAANGDSANKIGSYPLAVLAGFHEIPFYVAAPFSTFDFSLKTGAGIPIEERPGDEITCLGGVRTAPRGVKTYSPAFDVVPAKLISAIITEKGVIRPPLARNIRKTRDES